MPNFTPEDLLSAPRRSAGIPNADGTLLLHTVSEHSFETHSKTSEIRVLNVQTGLSSLISNNEQDSNPAWLEDESHVLWLRKKDDGSTELWVRDAGNAAKPPYQAGKINGPVTTLKAKRINKNVIAIAISGQAAPDGTLYNPQKALKSSSTGREFDSLYVRYWDKYVTAQHNALWYATLRKKTNADSAKSKERYSLDSDSLINALEDSRLESPTPEGYENGGDFGISSNGIIFIAEDPDLDRVKHASSNVYYIRLETFTETPVPRPRLIKVPGFEGPCSSLIFSPDGNSAAFMKLKSKDRYYGTNCLFVVNAIHDADTASEIYSSPYDGSNEWAFSPDIIRWSNDGTELYVTAEQEGYHKLFSLSLTTSPVSSSLKVLVSNGSVSEMCPITTSRSDYRLLVTKSTFIDSSVYSLIDPSTGSNEVVSSVSQDGLDFGIKPSQVTEVWFKAGGDYNVHAWVIKPSTFETSKTYPVAFCIHGGPISAWLNGWSTRWNPMVIAEQGYIVILPNITGSTGYASSLMYAIKDQYGGQPYNDMVSCFSYVKHSMPYADTTRAVALGGSYGGYLINWIAGHPLGKRFQALVTHDGFFSMNKIYSGDRMFYAHDFSGDVWENRAEYDKWDPSRHTHNWTTPMLIIHSDFDYRCPVTEGLAPFTVLQRRGVASRFLNFPDEGHWVLKAENSLHWHKTVLGWINKFARVEGGCVLDPIIST